MSFFCDDVDTALGGYHTSAYTGLGLRGDAVPSTGADGPSALYPCITLPADAATEVFMQLTRLPTLGTLSADEDGSFYYSGATDYFEFRLWINGIAASADVGYGAGKVRVFLYVGGGPSPPAPPPPPPPVFGGPASDLFKVRRGESHSGTSTTRAQSQWAKYLSLIKPTRID